MAKTRSQSTKAAPPNLCISSAPRPVPPSLPPRRSCTHARRGRERRISTPAAAAHTQLVTCMPHLLQQAAGSLPGRGEGSSRRSKRQSFSAATSFLLLGRSWCCCHRRRGSGLTRARPSGRPCPGHDSLAFRPPIYLSIMKCLSSRLDDGGREGGKRGDRDSFSWTGDSASVAFSVGGGGEKSELTAGAPPPPLLLVVFGRQPLEGRVCRSAPLREVSATL